MHEWGIVCTKVNHCLKGKYRKSTREYIGIINKEIHVFKMINAKHDFFAMHIYTVPSPELKIGTWQLIMILILHVMT